MTATFFTKIWDFLKSDSWQSWIVSFVLVLLFIKFIFFPFLSFLTGSPLPLVVVESCSMYHESSFDEWWNKNSAWYTTQNISRSDFLSFPMRAGLNKGDIILVKEASSIQKGDIIIFHAQLQYPLIHRVISLQPLSTKGDHNIQQLSLETALSHDAVFGKAVAHIPLLGWIKLIFFDLFKPEDQQGFCT